MNKANFHFITMASLIELQQSLEDSNIIDTLLQCFVASEGTKMLKDYKETKRENEITDLFLTTAGCEAIIKISIMAYPINLEDLTLLKNKSNRKKKYET